MHSHHKSCPVLREFVLLILFFPGIYFVTCGCVYVHKIWEMFGSCKKSFSWLGQKVNKKIYDGDAYGHNADDFSSNLCPWPRDDASSRQDISTPFNILT